MSEPAERRPAGTVPQRPGSGGSGSSGVGQRLRPHSMLAATVEALAVALVAAVVWALLKGILEFGAGLLGVAVVAGWAIGAVYWQVRANPIMAGAIAVVAWVVGLILTWLLAMAILPSSSRTFLERVDATPFTDWLSPQFGLIEIAGLVLYVVAALYGARPRS